MALPGTTVYLRKAAGAANTNDVQRIPHVLGVASAGQIGVPTTITSTSDLEQFGYGPGVEMVAEIGALAGWPVYFTRVATSTPSVLGSVLKVPKNISAGLLYGGILILAGGGTGEVFVTAKVAGLSVVVVDPGVDGALGHTYSNGLITITLAYAMGAVTTTVAQLTTYINASISTYLFAFASGVDTVVALTSTSIVNGDISYLPRQEGVTIRHVASGNNTALSVSVSTKAVTVNLATDANGTPTSTAAQVVAAIALSSAASLLLTPTASGTGAGLAGVWSAQTLTYGSTAAATLSGTPVDRSDQIILECIRGAAVGAASPPSFKWSWDRGNHWSGETLIPGTGIVALSDSLFISGVSVTFTGTLDVGDRWYSSASEPLASSSDLVTAIDTAATDSGKKWGFLCSPSCVSRSTMGSLDTKIQSYLQNRFCAGLFNTRDIGESPGTSVEVESDWRNSVTTDFGGFASQRGILAVSAGHFEHSSTYTGKQYHRPWVFACAARAASTPVHEDLGFTGRGPVANIGNAPPGYHLQTGADANGGVLYVARVPGVSIQHKTQSGNSKILTVDISTVVKSSGTQYTVTVNLSTDGGGVNNATATAVQDAVNAVAPHLLTATKTGTGGGIVGAMASTKAIVGRAVTHDEYREQGLHDQRFITSRSYDERTGAFYITSSPTMADPSETGWTLVEYRDVGLELSRKVKDAAFPHIQESLPGISVAESEVVPAGAIEAVTAAELEGEFGAVSTGFLFKRKSDGRVSASPYGQGEKPVKVRRNYSYLATRRLELDVGWVVLGLNQFVSITVTPKVPQ